MDTVSRAKRSAIMGAVRGHGNLSTELRMITLMRAAGIIGWRRGAARPGKPDFIFREEKVAIFVDGCFWHRCPRHGRTPKTRIAFWTTKLVGNARRDRAASRALRTAGWRVLRVWECALSPKHSGRTIARLACALGRA